MPITRSLINEIQLFNQKTLRHVGVHYVSRSRYAEYAPKTHGYIVVGTPEHGRVFHCGSSIMHAPFEVSKKLLSKALQSDSFTYDTKEVLKKLAGKTFPTVEHFLRVLLHKKNNNYTDDKIDFLINDPDEELKKLVTLNKKMNHQYGAVLARGINTREYTADVEAFEKGKIAFHTYSQINPTIIYDLFAQQQLFMRYMEEKAGIGKSNDQPANEKNKISAETTKKIMDRFVYHIMLPNKKDPHEANCNKSAATFLQQAENISADKDHRVRRRISGVSVWSIGSNQRMCFWQQTKASSFNQVMQDLIAQKDPSFDLQEFANNKDKVFDFICKLPLDQQKNALEKCLDKKTSLGKIFFAKRSSNWFNPSWSCGYLEKVQQKLEDVNILLFRACVKKIGG